MGKVLSKSYGSQETLPDELPMSKVKLIEHDRQCRVQTKKRCKSPSYWSPKCKCMTGIRKPRTKKVKGDEQENVVIVASKSKSLSKSPKKASSSLPRGFLRRMVRKAKKAKRPAKGLIISVPQVEESSSSDEAGSLADFIAEDDEDLEKVQKQLEKIKKGFQGKMEMIGEMVVNKQQSLSKKDSASAKQEDKSLERVWRERQEVEKKYQAIKDKYEIMLIRDNMKPKAERRTREITTEYYEKLYEFKKMHPQIWENPKLQLYSSRKSTASKSKSLSTSRSS